MITIRKLTYQLKEKPEQSFTRLKWAVEQVDSLFSSLLTNSTLDTNRPWVGILNNEKLSFSLIKPKSLISSSPLQLIIKGDISDENQNSIVRLRVQFGPYLTIFYGLTLILFAVLIISLPYKLRTEEVILSTGTLFIFLVILIIITKRSLLKIETELDQLFNEF